MRKNDSIESFLGEVNIKFVEDQIKKVANAQMSVFLGGEESYIKNCSIYIGMINERNSAFSDTDDKGYILLPQNNSEVQCAGIEKDNIQEFENAMQEMIESKTKDRVKKHYTIGHSYYKGSGQSCLKEENDNDFLNPRFVSWCVYSSGDLHISRLVRKVILLFLEECFRDAEEIRSLSRKDEKAAQEWLEECLKKIEFNFVNKYVHEVQQTYHIDIDSCNKISLEFYEKRICKGRALFVPRDVEPKQCWKSAIMFESAEELSKARKLSDIQSTRKFLEACQESYLLIRESDNELIGFLFEEKIVPEYVTVQFQGIASWELKIGEEMILCYKQGDYFATRITYEQSRYLVIEEHSRINFAEKIIAALEKTSHGALVIIAKDAENEARRLANVNRAVKIESFLLDGCEKMITSMASIDGAILVDYDGWCKAFGVILDGKARVKGKEERGARYNSAMNYIGGKERIAIVVSEDRTKGIVVEYGKDIKLATNNK